MTKSDPFGLLTAASEVGEGADPKFTDKFPPKSRPRDPDRAAAAKAASQTIGAHRTAPNDPAPAPPAAPNPTGELKPAREARPKLGRIRISELSPKEDPREVEDRAQLNIYAPVSVVRAWKKMVQEEGSNRQWRLLARAIELLEEERRAAGGS